ncbi:MAG: amidohydrolase family protein, partial [Negativicutes bacterium]|nr:amidohydrolase family protein [Negativicutes bacterium]
AGLINAHCHAGMAMMRGWADDLSLTAWLNDRIFPFEEQLTAEDVYYSSLAAIGEMLLNGIVGFADQYFFCEQTARAVIQSGIRARLPR